MTLDFVSAFQVRQCYLRGTEEEGSAGKVVARLLNTAVSAGKRARSETSISKGEPGVKIVEGGCMAVCSAYVSTKFTPRLLQIASS